MCGYICVDGDVEIGEECSEISKSGLMALHGGSAVENRSKRRLQFLFSASNEIESYIYRCAA